MPLRQKLRKDFNRLNQAIKKKNDSFHYIANMIWSLKLGFFEVKIMKSMVGITLLERKHYQRKSGTHHGNRK